MFLTLTSPCLGSFRAMVNERDLQALVPPRLLQGTKGCFLVSKKAPQEPQASDLLLRKLNIAL